MPKVGQSLIDFEHYKFCVGEVRLFRENRVAAARVNARLNHNDLTCAFVAVLIILSGTRAIRRYLSKLTHQIDSDLSMIFPKDKDVSEVHLERIVILPSCVAHMLIEYARHLTKLVSSLADIGQLELASKFQALLDPTVSQCELPIDYFSLINENFQEQEISLCDIESALGYRWPIRLAETRGQYCRFMKTNGAAEFLNRQQRGHQSIAYPFFGVHNQYSVYEYRREFRPYTDLFATELGF
ncbi:MAG: hypothetical protein DRR42_22570 [Gammaproteobacteria bacterium]|nr:MAG: hypothetical protein DRR42_22570 [Gammaproteobacteria bacterium]